MSSDAQDVNPARADLHHEEYVHVSEIQEIDVKEIAGQQGFACARRESAPGLVRAAYGRGWQSMAPQGLADRGGRDSMSQTP
jgi:streptomycin 6-kinase